MVWWKFFIKKYFWIHLGIIVFISILGVISIFFILKIYTHHGKSFELYDFTGLTESQFQGIIKKNELRYIIIDSVYFDDTPKGTVVEQVPKPGSRVKKKRKIFFTINAWSDEQVSVPNLTDYSLRNARALLESYGLKPGELIYIPSEFANLVLGQLLNGKPVEPGSIVAKGTTIDLLIGRGLGGDFTSVPNLIGLEKTNAEQVLQNLFLYTGAVIFDGSVISSEDTAKAFIWRQIPAAKPGARINVGASIDIWLTLNEELLLDNDFDEDLDSHSDYESEFF